MSAKGSRASLSVMTPLRVHVTEGGVSAMFQLNMQATHHDAFPSPSEPDAVLSRERRLSISKGIM